MDSEMTVEKFSQYLSSEDDEGVLKQALRSLTTVSNPDEVRTALAVPTVCWTGWSY